MDGLGVVVELLIEVVFHRAQCCVVRVMAEQAKKENQRE